MFGKTQSLLVIGLGTFGTAVACRARANGARVLGVDIKQEIVDRLQEDLDNTTRADARDDKALAEIQVDDHDIVVIAVGADVEASLLATHHVKAAGAKAIYVKSQSEPQTAILQAIGVTQVLRPEVEAGRSLADTLFSKD